MGCGIQKINKINIIKSGVYIPKKTSKASIETINNERKIIDKISKKTG